MRASVDPSPFPIGEEDLVADAVQSLTNSERAAVFDALLGGHGSPTEIFLSLWRTVERPGQGEDPDEPEPDEEGWRTFPTDDQERVFGWIEEGMAAVL